MAPLLMVFCVRCVPSELYTLTVADDGMNAIGVIPQISNPRMSCSPPIHRRENGGTYLPPYPVMMLAMPWKAKMCVLCHGAGLKYLASSAGLRVFTLPPRTLPATSIERKRLRPPVGV